ncbi:hypothetical protein M0Q97_08340 [Candidatus Dojkabacteria bacterium]|jgi:hypothetical protein|nr:hypothetical protein [Candidatus Dojkabacteria bacterium]
MMEFKSVRFNEIELIENFSKEELEELLQIQIDHENYEGAIIIKDAIKNYDDYEFEFEVYFESETDESFDDYYDDDEED